MKLKLRYFASIRESLGAGESIDVAEGTTVSAVRDLLIARGGAHALALARGRALRCALDQVLCDETRAVADGSELAFFPPVTGG
ncbi:MAG: MoaD/ThiS family protein [Burkholderiales bacterium]